MKVELRKEIIERLKHQDRAQKASADQRLLAALQAYPAYQQARTIATYLSFEHEFATAPLIEQALRDGKRVCIPKTYPKGRMEFCEYNPENLQKTAFGLMEPVADALPVAKEEIDLIHVPGVIFNSDGYRIGYGGGYYDRYLTDFHGHTVSTIYAFQRGAFEVGAYDIPVEEVIVDEGNL